MNPRIRVSNHGVNNMKNIKNDINFAESVLGFASNDERKEYLRQQIKWCDDVLMNDGPARSSTKSNYGNNWRKRTMEDKKRFENELKNFSSSENDTNFIDIISMDLNVGDVRIYRGKEKKIKNITHTPTRYGLNTKVIYEDNSTEEFYPNQKVKVKIPNGISRFNFLRTNYDNDQFSENELKNFSTPVEDRSYRDALDAIEKAKTESDTSTFPHTPEKYQDYENAKDIADKNKRLYKLSKLDKNKQKPVPGSNIYVGSIFNTSIYLSPFGDKGMRLESNQCKLRIGNSKDSFEINTDGLKDGRLSPNERNRINNSNKAISDLKKYQKPMTVNSRKDFIKLAKEIADKLHQYNKQGL